jgi:hypothetical protein
MTVFFSTALFPSTTFRKYIPPAKVTRTRACAGDFVINLTPILLPGLLPGFLPVDSKTGLKYNQCKTEKFCK